MAKFCNVYNYIPSFCRYSDGTNASLVPVNWIIRKWQGKKKKKCIKYFSVLFTVHFTCFMKVSVCSACACGGMLSRE